MRYSPSSDLYKALIIALLAALIPQTALAAKPAPQRDPAAPPKADADGDKLFEDVEARAARLSDADEVEVIVVLRERPRPEHVSDLRAAGLAVGKRFELIDAVVGRISKGRLAALARRDLVRHVELNSRVRAWNDTAQQSFGVTAARANAPGLDGNADGNAHSYSRDDLVAAVIDTGIDASHRDLDGGKVIAFKDYVGGRTTPYDDEGHGTHVAATIAGDGEARADRRHAGVAPGAALVGVKVLDMYGEGWTDDIISGIEWVVQNRFTYGIEALNLSLGAAGCAGGVDADSLAVNAAHAAGVVVAVAAGNEGAGSCTIGSPGAAADALTVGAMADMGVGGFYQADFSSRGKTADGRVKPDVSAPGVDITSAAANTSTGYATASGTSMATPFVAGLALLMRDASPGLGAQAVKDAVVSTAVDWGRGASGATGSRGADPEYGAGRLDAYAALRTAGAALGGTAPGPVHELREGTLAGTGARTDYRFEVRDTSFPLAATLTIASLTAAEASSPDFDLFLYDPSGARVAAAETVSRQEQVSFRPTQTGTYTLRVYSYAGGGDYFLDVSAGLRDPSYVRPKSAMSVKVPLVIGFRPCDAATANRTHGPPLAYPSCNPPVLTSDQLTVGTPDSNGKGAQSVGQAQFAVLTGDPATSADEADVALEVRLTDVRRKDTLADYEGELQGSVGLRLTDRGSGASGTEPATVQDTTFAFAVPCVADADTRIGSACAVSTSADAVTPGFVTEGRRAIWQLGRLQVHDGGPDGVAATSGNTPFAVQGIFVP